MDGCNAPAVNLLSACLKILMACLPLTVLAQTVEQPTVKTGFGKPALITTADLADFDFLARGSPETDRSGDRGGQGLAMAALHRARIRPVGWRIRLLRRDVFRHAKRPPRSAAHLDRPIWMARSNGRLHKVPANTTDLKHPSLKDLRPADLLFWGRPGDSDSRRRDHDHPRGHVSG